jgi:hypothetical protein
MVETLKRNPATARTITVFLPFLAANAFSAPAAMMAEYSPISSI